MNAEFPIVTKQLVGHVDNSSYPVGTTEFPPIDTTLISGDIGFRQHTGGHTDGPTWPTFLTFADKYIKLKK
jgi:hypothetical protein